MGIEPISGCLQGILAALVHASPEAAYGLACRSASGKLRERESNPRRRAYETLLAPSPVHPAVIPDGLEPSLPGCEPGVVATGPRDQIRAKRATTVRERVNGSRTAPIRSRLVPTSNALGWIRTTGLHHVRVASTPLLHEDKSSRQESNLPEPAYQTGAWPLGHSWKRPVRGLNPSHPVDGRADTPASSQGQQQGWKDSNPLGAGWSRTALPGAHPCQYPDQESNPEPLVRSEG